MITEVVLKILLIIIAISFIQIAYNAFVYRQRGHMRWVKFSSVVVPTLIGGYLIFSYIQPLTELKYLNFIVEAIDSMIFTFFGYLPKNFLIIWFIAPMVIVWIVFLIITLITVLKNRYKYVKWKKRIADEEEQPVNQEAKSVTSIDEKDEATTTDIEVKEFGRDEEEKDIHFLNEPITKIRYKSILGVQRAYEVAKTKGLQLAETETGYVAVYAEKTGVKKLKEVFSQNGIDCRKLENRPSIVFFDLDTVQCVSIKEALKKMNGGEPIV